ncbi:class II aldolase/adducin head domain-containing protein [Peribacillus phoenicis]|uniref:hypothetical protein n=1 Tax=unclassified Peribacillus TaxID=2675266 RepID=UPI0039A0A5CE
MKQIYQYNKEYFYVFGGDLMINDDDPIPKWYTDKPPVTTGGQGMYKPKFINGLWEEASENTIPVVPEPPKTDIEILKEEIIAMKLAMVELAEMINGGV